MNFAQVANYTFTQTADTYTPITGGTVLFSGSFDENISLQYQFQHLILMELIEHHYTLVQMVL